MSDNEQIHCFHGGTGGACSGKRSMEPPKYVANGKPIYISGGRVLLNYICSGCGAGLTLVLPAQKDGDQAAERIMAWLLNETDMGSWHPNVIASVREAIEKSIAEAREDRDA